MRNSIAGSQTDIVLLDFSKAWHQKLLLKLYTYGIRGPTLKWIQAFLYDRTQTVVLENEKSDTVTSGVPQGSVLGPILFLIYINDLPDTTKSKVRLFADGTAIYLAVSSLEDAHILQQDLDHFHQWELQWDMDINPSKCVVIHVIRSRTPVPSQYLLHGQAFWNQLQASSIWAWKSATTYHSTITFRTQLLLQVGLLAFSREI